MRFVFTLILLVSVVEISFAQEEEKAKKDKIDSLTQQLKRDSTYIFRRRLAKPYFRLENRYSFISDKPVNLIGFLAGATFHEKHVICAGYYALNRTSQKSIEVTDGNNTATKEYLKLNYFIFSYQYVLFNKRFFQVNVPLEIGYGLYSATAKDERDHFVRRSTGNIIPISAGVQCIFKPVKWIGISCVGGYRHAVQEKNISLNFNGFYYSFGLWIDARHLIRHTKYYFKKRKYRDAVEELNYPEDKSEGT